MILADIDSGRKQASPGLRASCPSCHGSVIAKCGPIKVWHWAHETNECDPWTEPETRWHAGWKAEFPERCREVVIGRHRADVRLDNGCVIEFQHSALSSSEIIERERFYGSMVWVVDAERIAEHFSFRSKGGYMTFRWKWPRQVWKVANAPLFLDLQGELFRIHKTHWHEGSSAGGWGRFVDYERFIERASARILAKAA